MAKDPASKSQLRPSVNRPRAVRPNLLMKHYLGPAKHKMRDVLGVFSSHYPHLDLRPIVDAYRFARYLHDGQKRLTGDPYIVHPVDVAYRIARAGAGRALIASGLLHDVIEDCGVTYFDLANLFGRRVAELVCKVTKPKYVSSTWVFADEPRFYLRKDKYTDELYSQRADVYFSNLLQDFNAMLLKVMDSLSNLNEMETMPAYKRDRNVRTMIEQILWMVPRILGPEAYYETVFELKRWGFEIPEHLLPKDPESSIVVLPSRADVGIELFAAMPPPNADYLSVYLPGRRNIIFEIGFPSSIVGERPSDKLMRLVARIFERSVVTQTVSLVSPEVAAHETLLGIRLASPAEAETIINCATEIYGEVMAPHSHYTLGKQNR